MKRAAAETNDGTADEGVQTRPTGKRQRRPNSPANDDVSRGLYEAVKDRCGLDMPFEQFVGVCAYLVTILKWGYTLDECEIDHFVCRYPVFHAQLPAWESQRAVDATRLVPSYHQWFRQQQPSVHHDDGPPHDEQIIDEAALREIWREHPFTFLRAELSLDYLVGLKRRRQDRLGRHTTEGVGSHRSRLSPGEEEDNRAGSSAE